MSVRSLIFVVDIPVVVPSVVPVSASDETTINMDYVINPRVTQTHLVLQF